MAKKFVVRNLDLSAEASARCLQRAKKATHLESAVGPGFVLGGFGRCDEGHDLVRSFGGEDVGEGDVLVEEQSVSEGREGRDPRTLNPSFSRTLCSRHQQTRKTDGEDVERTRKSWGY